MHGLAGSGALTALVLAELPTAKARLLYIGTFGLGSAPHGRRTLALRSRVDENVQRKKIDHAPSE